MDSAPPPIPQRLRVGNYVLVSARSSFNSDAEVPLEQPMHLFVFVGELVTETNAAFTKVEPKLRDLPTKPNGRRAVASAPSRSPPSYESSVAAHVPVQWFFAPLENYELKKLRVEEKVVERDLHKWQVYLRIGQTTTFRKYVMEEGAALSEGSPQKEQNAVPHDGGMERDERIASEYASTCLTAGSSTPNAMITSWLAKNDTDVPALRWRGEDMDSVHVSHGPLGNSFLSLGDAGEDNESALRGRSRSSSKGLRPSASNASTSNGGRERTKDLPLQLPALQLSGASSPISQWSVEPSGARGIDGLLPARRLKVGGCAPSPVSEVSTVTKGTISVHAASPRSRSLLIHSASPLAAPRAQSSTSTLSGASGSEVSAGSKFSGAAARLRSRRVPIPGASKSCGVFHEGSTESTPTNGSPLPFSVTRDSDSQKAHGLSPLR